LLSGTVARCESLLRRCTDQTGGPMSQQADHTEAAGLVIDRPIGD
jgi:hypothetical protein